MSRNKLLVLSSLVIIATMLLSACAPKEVVKTVIVE